MTSANQLGEAESAARAASRALAKERESVSTELAIMLANATEAAAKAPEAVTAIDEVHQIVGAIKTSLRTLEARGRTFGGAIDTLDADLVSSDSATLIAQLRTRLRGVAGAPESEAAKIFALHLELQAMAGRAGEIAAALGEFRDLTKQLAKDLPAGVTTVCGQLDTTAEAISVTRGVVGDAE